VSAGAGDDARALEAAARELEEVAAALARGDLDPEEVRRLAERAVALSAEVGERLPRVLHDAEG
jgi:exonuclease VII small subunit